MHRLLYPLLFLLFAGCSVLAPTAPDDDAPDDWREEDVRLVRARPSALAAEPCSLGMTKTFRYGTHAQQTATLFLPNRKHVSTLAVSVHGGGWYQGSKAEHKEIAKRLVREGCLIVLTPDYRTDTLRAYPNQIEDVRASRMEAERWLAKNGYTYMKAILMGTSAGAYIAAQLSVLYPRDFQAVIGASGVYNMTWQDSRVLNMLAGADPFIASPFYRANAALPPHFLLVWDRDPKVAPSQTTGYRDALQGVGVPVEYVVDAGRYHDGRALILNHLNLILAWLAEVPN